MKTLFHQHSDPSQVLDCSQHDQIRLLADAFNVSPQAVKLAVRACCSNNIAHVSHYLQSTYLPAKNQRTA